MNFTIKCNTPQLEDYENKRVYAKDWRYFAEVLAVAKKNNHPLFDKAYEVLESNGLPKKVWEKVNLELEEYENIDYVADEIKHFCRITRF